MSLVLQFIWFFVTLWGLGMGVARWLPESQQFVERQVVRLALGLGIFPILMTVLDQIGIPLHWWIFTIIALAIPLITGIVFLKKERSVKFEWPDWHLISAILCVLVLFGVYVYGAHQYPYLEDDDPWENAAAASYVAAEKTLFLPEHLRTVLITEKTAAGAYFVTLPPYPPGYAGLMGVLHQLNPSINQTLKVFNALLVALSLLFFFLFARELLKNKGKALIATALLTIIPSYLSHFIWATSLAVPLFFIAWYYWERGKENKWFFGIAGLVVASLLVTSRSVSVIFGLMSGTYWVANVIYGIARKEKWLKQAAWFATPMVFGIIISFVILWFWVIPTTSVERIVGLSPTNEGGTKTIYDKVFSLKDFLASPKSNQIDQPYGWGIMITLLVFFGLIVMVLHRKNIPSTYHWLVTLGMFVITFLGTEGNALPYKIGHPHRFWTFLAIPTVLIAAEGLAVLWRSLAAWKIARFVVLGVIALSLIPTAAYPKFVVETSNWPPGVNWLALEELQGYQHLLSLPKQQKVFAACSDNSDFKVMGFDQHTDYWNAEMHMFRANLTTKSMNDLDLFLKKNLYEYIIIDPSCVISFGENQTNTWLQQIGQKYPLVHKTPAFFLFEVN